uniref:t-SNARE coiled-coil homology domain-containing protein n=1 Tax=Timema genevievae TaxID=629358 RepID=A0A7R9JTT2_TIMGE|nr:unnamed protein product [Timema genevievae]
MANRYLSDSNNSFFAIEDDVDDETFLRSTTSNSSGYTLPNNSYQNRSTYEDKRLQLLERKKQIEENTIKSSERSISLLRDSEQIGVATAEELMRQREQLERTEQRLDDINATLRFSQKHIQGIKSVFGSLKNYLSGKAVEPASSTSSQGLLSKSNSSTETSGAPSGKSDQSMTAQGAMSSADTHPGLRIRGLVEQEEVKRNRPPAMSVNQILDNNLLEMGDTITRLKGLAQGLGEELDSQNDLLESITDKTESTDFKIQQQNKDMKKLLKK